MGLRLSSLRFIRSSFSTAFSLLYGVNIVRGFFDLFFTVSNTAGNCYHAQHISEYNSNMTKLPKPEGTAANPDKSEIPTKVRRGPEERERSRVRVNTRETCV